MKYLCLIYDDEKNWTEATEERTRAIFGEHTALYEDAKKAGAYVGGEGLQPIRTATTLRVRDGRAVHTDGPYAETKEQLGGFYLFDCKDLDEALAWAAKIPEAKTGAVEVRPVMVFE